MRKGRWTQHWIQGLEVYRAIIVDGPAPHMPPLGEGASAAR